MEKAILFTATFLFSFTSTFAQEVTWFPENSEWYYTAHCLIDPQCGFLRYYTTGDTLLAGKAATVVDSQFESDESSNSFLGTHYFRVENDTVFYFSASTNGWSMLYDFNAQPGDVWNLTETLSEFLDYLPDVELEAYVEVDSVTTEMLGGVMRRVIYTSPLYNEEAMEPESDWMFIGPIVEGIGPIGGSQGLFGENVMQSPGGWLPHFSCYRENNEQVYGSDDNPCGIVSNVKEKEVPNVGIYPNPATNKIHLQLPPEFVSQAEVAIYNMAGQIVQTHEDFDALSPLSLNLSPGVYVVEARIELKIARGKVVVR